MFEALSRLIPVGSARWLAGACFAATLGVALFFLAGTVGKLSDRWGVYGILFLQTGGWQAVMFQRPFASIGMYLGRLLGLLLVADMLIFLMLDSGDVGPIVTLYYGYELVLPLFALAGAVGIGYGVIGAVSAIRSEGIRAVGIEAIVAGFVVAVAIVGASFFRRDFDLLGFATALIVNLVLLGLLPGGPTTTSRTGPDVTTPTPGTPTAAGVG